MNSPATLELPEPAPIRSEDGLGGRMEMHSISIFWYSVGVWQRFKTLTWQERKQAGEACSDALSGSAALAVGDGETEIPHFGKCGGHKCAAIMSCFIVSGAKTNHIESPFLAAAREAQRCAELLDSPHAGGKPGHLGRGDSPPNAPGERPGATTKKETNAN